MGAEHVNDKTFDEQVLKAELPVLVDFWAEWCGPCKMIGPIVEEIAGELEGRMKVAKVNVDEAQELASKYGIMSIPTLLLFKEGEIVEQMIGAMPKEQLLEKLNAYLS